jgi:tetratricopeptide (TPR) repeat protein
MCLWYIGLCTPSQRHLDALTTKAGEKCGLPSLSRLAMLVVVSMSASCSLPEPPANRYQSDVEVMQQEARPVAELHKQALAAIDDGQYQQAIDYLQRAIKIQPRNAWSWHYLAQTYWHEGQFERCVAMIERSSSYGSYDDVLGGANDRLRAQCQ